MFTEAVNAPFINALFTAGRIPGMHETLKRLFHAATAATAHLPVSERVDDQPSSLARALNVSQQSVHNWSKRGVSLEAAVDAEGKFGCSAWWILKGQQPPGWQGHGEEPPLSRDLMLRLSRDSRAAAMWESAIRAALSMPPLTPDLGKRRAA
jgi:hypothetical protein